MKPVRQLVERRWVEEAGGLHLLPHALTHSRPPQTPLTASNASRRADGLNLELLGGGGGNTTQSRYCQLLHCCTCSSSRLVGSVGRLLSPVSCLLADDRMADLSARRIK
eukprot:GHVU01051082.1.p1 GENE.GHVU01051082.1~~GHVU01051082.1.p1  ORF type:complete len:109 (-),score=18.47 GHVU01051082.1:161-487(-)